MPQTSTDFLRGLRVQFRTVRSLIVRDMVMRYGRGNIGFVWVILEPMILTAGVMVIWSLMGSNRHGVKVIELVLTGYMPLTLWRHLTNSSVGLYRRSSPLLYHRQITLLDMLAARQALEFLGTSAALLVVWGVLNAIGVIGDIQQPDLFVLGWLMMASISFGFSAVIAAVSETSEAAERLIQPLQYLNIPISGAFFLVDWLPDWGQKLILWHPLVHCFEVFRAGYFGRAIVSHYSVSYFCVWAFFMAFAGLLVTQLVRNRVQLN